MNITRSLVVVFANPANLASNYSKKVLTKIKAYISGLSVSYLYPLYITLAHDKFWWCLLRNMAPLLNLEHGGNMSASHYAVIKPHQWVVITFLIVIRSISCVLGRLALKYFEVEMGTQDINLFFLCVYLELPLRTQCKCQCNVIG